MVEIAPPASIDETTRPSISTLCMDVIAGVIANDAPFTVDDVSDAAAAGSLQIFRDKAKNSARILSHAVGLSLLAR